MPNAVGLQFLARPIQGNRANNRITHQMGLLRLYAVQQGLRVKVNGEVLRLRSGAEDADKLFGASRPSRTPKRTFKSIPQGLAAG